MAHAADLLGPARAHRYPTRSTRAPATPTVGGRVDGRAPRTATLVARPVTLVGLSADPGVRPARRRKALVPGVLGPSDNAAGGRLGRREPGERCWTGH